MRIAYCALCTLALCQVNLIMGQSNADARQRPANTMDGSAQNIQMHTYMRILHTYSHSAVDVIMVQSNAVQPDHRIHRSTVVQ